MLYKILWLEDDLTDVELMQHELLQSNISFDSEVLYLKKDFMKAVDRFKPDIVLGDYSLPSFDGMKAFRMLRKSHSYIPFILVTGVLSEQVALECLKEGVDDFILKSSFRRLPMAIHNAIRKKENEKEKAIMAEELEKSHEELRAFLNKQQMAREEERHIIARDLHDELGQVLTALKIDITMFGKKILSGKEYRKEELESEMKEIIGMVDQTTRSVKRISSGLRPEILDELGISEAIEWLVKDFEKRNKIRCNIDLPDEISVNSDFPITLYRIVQEALTNIARHAEATKVNIKLEITEGLLKLEIGDNGKGIMLDKINSSSSLGIIGVRERVGSLNGKFKISSENGYGTIVSALIPLNPQ